MSGISVKKMKGLVDKAKELKDKHAEMKKDTAKVWAEFEEAKRTIINYLEHHEMDFFPGSKCKVGLELKETVPFPSDPHLKKKVFDYYKKKYGADALMGKVSISAGTFKTLWKNEKKLYESENENAFDFEFPGIPKETVTERWDIKFYKKK